MWSFLFLPSFLPSFLPPRARSCSSEDGGGGRRQRNLLDGSAAPRRAGAVRFDEGVGQLGLPRSRSRPCSWSQNRKQCSVALHCNSSISDRRPNNNSDASCKLHPSSESSTPAAAVAAHARTRCMMRRRRPPPPPVRESGTAELHL